MKALLKILGYLWASPWTLVGLFVGAMGLLTGGKARRGPGIIEFYGGTVSWCLARFPVGPAAMTLGHVVLGRTAATLDISQRHELVHVRQYERWGPLFIPAYLLCSLVLKLRGKDAYRDNPFEREAFEA